MSVPGKLEATIKISELPTSEVVENGWRQFTIDCDGRQVSATVNRRSEKADNRHEQYESWVAAITGWMEKAHARGVRPEIPAFKP